MTKSTKYNRYDFLIRTVTGGSFVSVLAISYGAALADLAQAYTNLDIINCTVHSA